MKKTILLNEKELETVVDCIENEIVNQERSLDFIKDCGESILESEIHALQDCKEILKKFR